LTAAERRLARLLTVLIEDFEAEAYCAQGGPSGRGAARADAGERTQTEGPARHLWYAQHCLRSVTGEARLTVEYIRKLSRRFHVSPEVFF
jgi:antitoxin component HigA of HigAB toxin-antitoxin module